MTNEQIREKYGIEPIMKEMWVWGNDGIEFAELCFVISKDGSRFSPYVGYNSKKEFITRTFASETHPNEKEPKVGDNGYFWDDEGAYLYATIINIEQSIPKYDTDGYGIFTCFSHEKQPWMK